MPDSVGYVYLAIYVAFALGFLISLFIVFYIIKRIFFKKKKLEVSPENTTELGLSLEQTTSYIKALELFKIFTIIAAIISASNIFMQNRYIPLTSDINIYILVILIYINDIHKNIFMKIAFYIVVFSILFKVSDIVQIFGLLPRDEIINMTTFGINFLSKIVDVLTLFFIPLLLLSFYKFEQNKQRKQKIKIIIISFLVLMFILPSSLSFIDSEFLGKSIVVILYIVYSSLLWYFAHSYIKVLKNNELTNDSVSTL